MAWRPPPFDLLEYREVVVMKCLVVFRNPSMPDIVLLKADKAFINHINQAARERHLLVSGTI